MKFSISLFRKRMPMKILLTISGYISQIIPITRPKSHHAGFRAPGTRSLPLFRAKAFRIAGLRLFLFALILYGAAAAATDAIPAPPADLADKVDWLWKNKIKPTVMSGQGLNNFFDQLFAASAQG